MFDRPNEPSFTKKGDNEVAFDVPAEFFVSETIIILNYYNNYAGFNSLS